MVFCGQCGLNLTPGTTRCPRCGAVADTTPDVGVDTFPTDSPTIEAHLYTQGPQANIYTDAPYPSVPFTPPDQQKLVLRAGNGGDNSYSLSGDNEPTSILSSVDYSTQQHTPVNFQSTPSYSSEPHNAGYPMQANNVYNNGDYTPANYPGTIPPGGAGPAGYPPMSSTRQKKRSALPVILALLSLLLIVSVSTFFVIERFHLLSNIGVGTNNGSPTPLSPVEQAKGVVQRYYADVNNKNYQDAYNLWKWDANAPSFAKFEQGYANTEHDELTIGNTTQLGNGTVKVALAIVATERVASGLQYHTYSGYYIVGQSSDTWKILRGILN